MVVRTIIVVHMAQPKDLLPWERWWFRALNRLPPLKGLNGKRQSLWCNNLTIPALALTHDWGDYHGGLARIKEGGLDLAGRTVR